MRLWAAVLLAAGCLAVDSPAATHDVHTKAPPAADPEPRHLRQRVVSSARVVQGGHKVHSVLSLPFRSTPSLDQLLIRVGTLLSRKRKLDEKSLKHIAKLEARGEEMTREERHVVAKRKLRMESLTAMEEQYAEALDDFETILTNFTIVALVEGLQHRLAKLQRVSLDLSETKSHAEELESEEKKHQELAQRRFDNDAPPPTGKGGVFGGLIADIGNDVGGILDDLDTMNKGQKSSAYGAAKQSGNDLETVIKMHDGGGGGGGGGKKDDAGIVSHLIDTSGNQYVLSLPRDPYIHYEDSFLIHDIVCTIVSCLIVAGVAKALKQPLFFGYLAAGMVLSPSVLGALRSVVQIETIAQFGVYLLLFLLGMEFSVGKLRALAGPACVGGLLYLAVIVFLTTKMFTEVFGASGSEGILVGFCVSLSSTIVVLRMMGEGQNATPYGQLLLAVLIIQDVVLGLMVASVPLLGDETLDYGVYLAMFGSLTVIIALVFVVSKLLIPPALAFVMSSRELLLLGLCSLCFLMMLITEKAGVSMEVGCFLAGLAISPYPAYHHDIEATLQPVQEFFGAIFFVSIGIHISPDFLMQEFGTLIAITVAVVGFKWCIGFCIYRFIFRYSTVNASLVGLGLSQMSEFSFVIASRGKAHGLINREVYFMLLGITSLSLIVTPLLWRYHPTPEPVRRSPPVSPLPKMRTGSPQPPTSPATGSQW